MATRICPSCGTIDYGTPFCVSCQKPMPKGDQVSSLEAEAVSGEIPAVVNAGFFRRLAAFFIDWLVLSVIADIFRFVYTMGSRTEPGGIPLNLAMGLSTTLFLLYFTLFTGDGGQTLGKMAVGVRVRRLDGSPMTHGRAFLRTLGYFVSFFFGTFLGFIWALWDRKKQGWHDKIAGTEVIKV